MKGLTLNIDGGKGHHARDTMIAAVETESGEKIPIKNVQSVDIKIVGGELNRATIEAINITFKLRAVLEEFRFFDKDGVEWTYVLVPTMIQE